MRLFTPKIQKEEKGYILLLAILVTSIILAISFGIYAIGIKEVILSSYLRDSQQAFAAADRALECALMWDVPYKDSLDPDGSGPKQGLRWSIFATGTIANNVWQQQDVRSADYQYPPITILDSDGTTRSILGEVKCGLNKIFPVDGSGNLIRTESVGAIFCTAHPIVPESGPYFCVQGNAGNMETQFLVKFGGSDRTCALVTVTKYYDIAHNPRNWTVFRSDGFNDCNSSNSRRTQRTIEVTSNG